MDNMLWDTGKVKAICSELDIDIADLDEVLPAIQRIKAEFNKLVNEGYRHTKGLLRKWPMTDSQVDDIIADLIKYSGERRKNKR